MQGQELSGFYEATRNAKKIIVVDLGFLGDTVHLIPALWEIKDHHPGAELHVLTSPLGREVLGMVGCVQRAWAFPLGPPSPPWWKHWGLIRALRSEKFDVSFNFGGADRSVFVSALLRAPHSVAFQGARRHFWQPWLFRHWIPRRQLPVPAYEARRQILALCGFNLKPARFDLRVPVEDRQWAEQTVPAGAVHLSLSASHPLKEWPLANSIQLIRLLHRANPERTIVVTAASNPREQARVKRLREEIKEGRLLVLNESLSIARLAALLQRCALHVGPDSGVLHLAAALGVGTVAIFRRYPAMADWLPQGPRHICFDAPCPCMEQQNPACASTGEAACLGGISPEAVGGEIGRLLAADPV